MRVVGAFEPTSPASQATIAASDRQTPLDKTPQPGLTGMRGKCFTRISTCDRGIDGDFDTPILLTSSRRVVRRNRVVGPKALCGDA